jgi:putative heme-binding domain-containing protein
MTWRLALLLVLSHVPLLAEELDYRVLDPDLKVVRLDSSNDDSFLSVRLDTTGRIFVGGRKTLFAYDLDEAGKYKPRKLLFEFPDHTWVNDIEIRGDDLYVVTVSAVYRLPGARLKRDGVTIERLLWGVPNGHVHQCFHACAWGPEGDLYVSMGDPLWYYGDFTRPDHWGHWTMFFKSSPVAERSPAAPRQGFQTPNDADSLKKPADKSASAKALPAKESPGESKTDRSDGIPVAKRQGYGVRQGQETIRIGNKDWATMPYNGVGGVFRIRPDGSNLQIFSRGLRNPCGLCFDKNWNLFTNDNDHEGLPSAYVPGRLLHVTEGSYFSWPRGWLQSKSPDRADILPSLNENLGRFVPVLQTYYADGYLPEQYDNNLLVARWCRRQVTRFPLEAKGNTFVAKEHVLLEGKDQARPVGVCVGRGGRVFVTICYMAQNEGSPVYRSDLAVITRKDDPDTMPFDGYDVTTCNQDRLQKAMEDRGWWNRNTAHQEELRRPVRSSAPGRITKLNARGVSAVARLIQSEEISEEVLSENGLVMTSLKSEDAFLRVPACLLLAQQGNAEQIRLLVNNPNAALRQAGVLAAGFRLTIPPVDAKLPDDAPLAPQQKEEANIILFADEKEPIDLRKFGRVGNYMVAEHWKALKHTDEQEKLFAMLVERLGDEDDKVRLQAAHFLSLLNDPRSEPKIAAVTANVQDKRLNLQGKLEHVRPQVWMLGPVPDADGFKTVHPIETAAIDLAAKYEVSGKSFEWKLTKTTSPDRPLYNFNSMFGPSPNSSVYSLVRFDVPTAQRMQLLVGSEDGVRVWHNGKLVFTNDAIRPLQQLDDVVPLDLLAGSNDILVRVRMQSGRGGQYLHFKHLGDVKLSLPEKPDGLSLADRLKSAGSGSQPIDPKFFTIDWSEAVKSGDVARGKKLFAAESLGCAKCHAATASQPGGGGPSLADAGKRFAVAYLVESVLAPNKVISPVFKSSTIETKEGKVLTGLIVSETGDKLELLLPDTKRVSLNKADIEARKHADISAMPAGIVKTPEELRDVIAYLLSNPTESAK